MQSKECETPKGLAIASANCTQLKVNWTGKKDQIYVVKATSATDSTTTIKASQPVCDNGGNCTATTDAVTGTTINWSVQTTCTQ